MQSKENYTCKNIFTDGKSTLSKEQFTRTWILLVNQLEQAADNSRRLQSLSSPEQPDLNPSFSQYPKGADACV